MDLSSHDTLDDEETPNKKRLRSIVSDDDDDDSTLYRDLFRRALSDEQQYTEDTWCQLLEQCRDPTLFGETFDIMRHTRDGRQIPEQTTVPYSLARSAYWRAFDMYIAKAKTFGTRVDLHTLLYYHQGQQIYIDDVLSTFDFDRIETVYREVMSPERNVFLLTKFVRSVTHSIDNLHERDLQIKTLSARVMRLIRSLTTNPTDLSCARPRGPAQYSVLSHATAVPHLFLLLNTRLWELVDQMPGNERTRTEYLTTFWNVTLIRDSSHPLAHICSHINRYQNLGEAGHVQMRKQLDLIDICVANGSDLTLPIPRVHRRMSCVAYAVDLNNQQFITKLTEYPGCHLAMRARAHRSRNPIAWAILNTVGLEGMSDFEDDEDLLAETERIRMDIEHFVRHHTREEVFDRFERASLDIMYIYLGVMRRLRPDLPWA